MLNAGITIERSSEIVWAYFIEPNNWEKWWLGGGLKTAKWCRGGQLLWSSGVVSSINDITLGRMIDIPGDKISAGQISTTFYFVPKGSGETIVNIQDGLFFGNVLMGDGGPSRLAQLNSSLVKLKASIESETKQNM
jgi:hypothetical protein